jgi:phage terminase small subunit
MTRAIISEQQKRACHEFLIDGNQVQACIRAGYSAKNARQHAHRVFALPHVKLYLAPLLEKMHEKTQATAERVLEELTYIAMSNIASFYKRQGKKWVLKDLDELHTSQQRCISEIEPGKYIKLHSKDSALDKLAKHFKLYTDLEAGTAQFNIMPVLRINGTEVVFEVGKPAPTARGSK